MRRQFDKRASARSTLKAAARRPWSARPEPGSTAPRAKKAGGVFSVWKSAVSAIKRIFRPKAPWELKAIAAAEAKRDRRRERNIR